MKDVLPTITGRVGSARNTVRAVRMPNALDGLGESISRFGKTLGNAANAAVGMATELYAERNRAALSEAMTAFEADVDKQIDMLKDRKGFGAADTPEAVDNIYEQAIGKHSANLYGKSAEIFRERALSRRNAHRRWGMDYERSQITEAENAARKERLIGDVKLYQQTQDPEILKNWGEDIDNRYRQESNYGKTPDEDLAAFDTDIKDGVLHTPQRVRKDGTVIPAKKYVIGQDITEERIAELRSMLEKKAESYRLEKQGVRDTFVSAAVEELLNAGDLQSAELYFDAIQTSDYAVSEKTAALIGSALAKYRKAYDLNFHVTNQMDTLTASVLNKGNNDTYTAGGRYSSPDIEQAMTEHLSKLQRAAESGDPEKVAEYKKTSELWNQRKRLMEQQEKADYAAALKDMVDNGKLDIDKIDETLEDLRKRTPNAVSVLLYETVLNQKAALEKKIPQKDSTMIKNEIFLRLADPSPDSGVVSVGGKPRNLKDEKDRHAVLLYYGFDKPQVQAIDRAISQEAHKYTSDAAHIVAEVLNSLSQTKKFTSENVLAVAAPLVTEAMSVVNAWTDDPTKYKNYTNEMKQHLLKLCVQLTAEERKAFWFDKDYTALSYLEQGIGEDGRPVRDENGKVKYSFGNMIKFHLTPEGREIYNRCRAEAEAFANGKIWLSDAVPETFKHFKTLPQKEEAK